MSGYDVSYEAERDLDEIWNYIAFDSPASADRVVTKLFDAFDLLASRPKIGHPRQDLTPYPVLFWPVGNYLVIYRPKKPRIQIVAVVRGSRDVPCFLRRLHRWDFE